MRKDPNRYPKGLSAAKVKSVIAFYDRQSEDDAVAEADAAWENSRTSLVRVPTSLVPQVEALIAKHSSRSRPTRRKKAS